MEKPTLGLIIGSIRPNRFAIHAANWIAEVIKKQDAFHLEVIDLMEVGLPMYAETATASSVKDGAYTNEVARAYAQRIKKCDAFVMVSPEYNHSTSPALANALDHVFAEWNKKPVAFVAYGSAGGARAVEHLRGMAVELDMVPVRNAVHIPAPWGMREANGDLKPGALDGFAQPAEGMLGALLWWTNALIAARQAH